ncbi:MAG: efflux RND transporter periplasmic adaptor subunit [Leptolyngbyaceae cyanobacterium]|uniref:efflux RND transporter periplasmic adaptor subunit n=2 Tax=Leptodesmis TaxID=2664261 RepID=UPI001F2593AA|nr:efflux RND transporter periplasmic adaptor subunit [Leptodesmis sichuanensis]UIE38624.1 efflux RND transporter periplasmic adaptor subunit [Leptodesmis sichuanensis A121]
MQLPWIDKVTKRSSPWLIGLLAAGLVGVPAATFVALRNAAPKQNIAEYTIPVQQKDVTVRITANGEVIPVQRLNLNPKTAGRLAELYVEQGDRVQQGQLIARMDNRELQAQRQQALAELSKAESNLSLLKAGSRPEAIGQAQAGVNQAQAAIAAAQTRLDLANQRASRNQALAAEGAISRDRLDEVINEQRSAKANLEQAKASYNNAVQQLNQQENGPRSQEVAQAAAQVEAARANLKAIDTQIEDTIIRAPFAGIITQKNATPGDFVTPTSFASSTSSATSIVTLANDLEILAKVPEVDIGQIKPGQEVEIRVDAFPNQTFKGIVRLVSPEAKEDPTQRGVITFEVRVRIVSGKDKLRSGMTTDLAFLGKQKNNALMVPTVAIVTNKGQPGVLIPDRNNKPRFQPVTIGPNIGNETEIIEGIKPGDPVFVELPAGQKLDDVIKGMEKK